MAYTDWKDQIHTFKKIDVRGVAGNFLEGMKKQATALPVGAGLEVVQSFEPIPLYDVMDMLGYERHTEKLADTEYHAWFYRTEPMGSFAVLAGLPAVRTFCPSSGI